MPVDSEAWAACALGEGRGVGGAGGREVAEGDGGSGVRTVEASRRS
jgi:hypothetical protein